MLFGLSVLIGQFTLCSLRSSHTVARLLAASCLFNEGRAAEGRQFQPRWLDQEVVAAHVNAQILPYCSEFAMLNFGHSHEGDGQCGPPVFSE